MNEPGKEVAVVLPGRLRRLRQEAPAQIAEPLVRRVDEMYVHQGIAPIGPTARRRLVRAEQSELRYRTPGYVVPTWLDLDEAIPGLIISMRYSGQDLHGIGVRMRELDLAFRRAAATLYEWNSGFSGGGWAWPLRPERGGLWTLHSRRGSFELVATVYGDLVSIATSSPIALAGLAALAFDAKVAARRAGSWVGRVFQPKPSGSPPELGEPSDGERWSSDNTKVLERVMLEAIESGAGFEFVSRSAVDEIRLAVPPRSQWQTEDSPHD